MKRVLFLSAALSLAISTSANAAITFDRAYAKVSPNVSVGGTPNIADNRQDDTTTFRSVQAVGAASNTVNQSSTTAEASASIAFDDLYSGTVSLSGSVLEQGFSPTSAGTGQAPFDAFYLFTSDTAFSIDITYETGARSTRSFLPTFAVWLIDPNFQPLDRYDDVGGSGTLSFSNIAPGSYGVFIGHDSLVAAGGLGIQTAAESAFGNFGFDIVPSAAPEPASWALMIGGLGIAGGAMRRRRARIAISYS